MRCAGLAVLLGVALGASPGLMFTSEAVASGMVRQGAPYVALAERSRGALRSVRQGAAYVALAERSHGLVRSVRQGAPYVALAERSRGVVRSVRQGAPYSALAERSHGLVRSVRQGAPYVALAERSRGALRSVRQGAPYVALAERSRGAVRSVGPGAACESRQGSMMAGDETAEALVRQDAAQDGFETGSGAGGARWRIDPAVSEAGFAVRVLLVRKIHGEFRPLEGFVHRDAETGLADVEVRIDTRHLRMNNPDHADWARSAEFFDAERHPSIHFQSAPFDLALLRSGGPLRGMLTLRGITEPVSFELQPSRCDRPGFDCPVRAEGDLERSLFGMTARRYAVSDKVQLSLAILVSDEQPAEGLAP